MSVNMVDWELAVSLGSSLAGKGPEVTRAQADAVVQELRDGAARSTGLVREFTGLDAPDGTAPLIVVDRGGWIQANSASFAKILTPITAKLTERKGPPTGVSLAIGSKITGAEIGGVLGFMATKVLGQFDPFFEPAGRLMLVAPNIVHVERELDVDPSDFRLWVCLHEETHRVQFTAVPWMREHLYSQIEQLSATLDSQAMEEGMRRIAEAVKVSRAGGGSLLDVMGTPEQKAIMDNITGMMSLLEGHADVVMDDVGPQVIGSVRQIRAKFNKRRQGVGVLDKLLRRVLGLDAKMAQYRDGAAFVRHVVDKVGMAEFNAVWAEPANLPSKAEVLDPPTWVARVL